MRLFERVVRARAARIATAGLLAASALRAFAPYVMSEVGGEAYVNAPLVRIASPIAGTVGAGLPAAGSYVAAARRLRLVTARSVDSDALGDLLGQRAALRAAAALAERQLAELRGIDTGLAARAATYERAAVSRLTAGTDAARADARACAAEAAAADLQRARVVALAASGYASRATLERTAAAADATHARCAASSARAAAAASELAAARAGLSIGDGASDTPYVTQQRDRLLLRRQELETVAADARSRLAELDARIAAERRRVDRASAYDATLPAASVVWSIDASPGASVVPGTPLVQLADCTRRFVEVTLPERRIESLVPGAAVSVRLIGADAWQAGHIVRVAGAAARRDAVMAAADDAERDGRASTIEIALPPAPPQAAARRCDVGRLAEVRFARWRG